MFVFFCSYGYWRTLNCFAPLINENIPWVFLVPAREGWWFCVWYELNLIFFFFILLFIYKLFISICDVNILKSFRKKKFWINLVQVLIKNWNLKRNSQLIFFVSKFSVCAHFWFVWNSSHCIIGCLIFNKH